MFNRDLVKITRPTKTGFEVIYPSLKCDIQEDRSRNNISSPVNQSLLRKVIFIDRTLATFPIYDKDIITNLNTGEEYRAIGRPYGGRIITKRIQLLAESK